MLSNVADMERMIVMMQETNVIMEAKIIVDKNFVGNV